MPALTRTSRRALELCALLLVGTTFSCAQPAPPTGTYPILIVARSDDGEPLAAVSVQGQGRELGLTDAQGQLEGVLQGEEGLQVQLQASCPEGYDGPREDLVLFLRRFQSVDPNADRRTTLRLTCVARERTSVVAIRTGRPGIPVLLRGEEVARTSTSGTAHVLVTQAPGSTFQLTLDTGATPALRPQSPRRLFTFEPRDDFEVWDQSFEEQKKKPVRRKRKKKAPEPPPKLVPYRID